MRNSKTRKKVIPTGILAMVVFQFLVLPTSAQNPKKNAIEYITGNILLKSNILNSSDIAIVDGFPVIGKWMYQDDMMRAHWLGIKWENKNLIEPINVILIDKRSKTIDEAISILFENLNKAGYTDRTPHSSGYLGYIGDRFYSQLPQEKHHAFSNEISEIDNNHGRIFGPYHYNGSYIFTGAFSREIIDPVSKVDHHYGSFNRARDEFSQSINKKSAYRIAGFVDLKNFILNSIENTTGDHDGIAVVLSIEEQ
jgi:hypothetical protein